MSRICDELFCIDVAGEAADEALQRGLEAAHAFFGHNPREAIAAYFGDPAGRWSSAEKAVGLVIGEAAGAVTLHINPGEQDD